MIELKLPDEKFDLMNVLDSEIFVALKNEVVNVIKTFNGFESIQLEDVVLDEQFSSRRKCFGKDKNLYPNIVLSLIVKNKGYFDEFDLFIDSFIILIYTS